LLVDLNLTYLHDYKLSLEGNNDFSSIFI
jgi:hypothetical protein